MDFWKLDEEHALLSNMGFNNEEEDVVEEEEASPATQESSRRFEAEGVVAVVGGSKEYVDIGWPMEAEGSCILAALVKSVLATIAKELCRRFQYLVNAHVVIMLDRAKSVSSMSAAWYAHLSPLASRRKRYSIKTQFRQ